MAQKSILIVDDESSVSSLLHLTVEEMGHSAASVATTGEEAVEKVIELTPDLVLMDIHLAGSLDGVEAAEQIRQMSDVPIIFVTSHTDDYNFERAKLTRPSGYVLKPFKQRELQMTIEMALGGGEDPSQAAPESAKKTSVLVVDDSQMIQAMVKNLLEREGHRVEVTGLIKSAIDVLKSNRFDLILMDLNLPDFRGEQAIRLLRRNLQLDTPIVVLSGEIKSDTVVQLRALAVSNFVSKTADFEKRLLEEIAKVLG